MKFLCIIWSSDHFLTHVLVYYTFGHTHIKWSVSLSLQESGLPDSLQPHGRQPIRLLSPWDFPGKDTGVGCHFLLLGIFPTQGLNPGLPHYRQTLCCLSHRGSHQGRYMCTRLPKSLTWISHHCSLWRRYGIISYALSGGNRAKKEHKKTIHEMSTNYCGCNCGHWYQQIWSEYHLFHLNVLWSWAN